MYPKEKLPDLWSLEISCYSENVLSKINSTTFLLKTALFAWYIHFWTIKWMKCSIANHQLFTKTSGGAASLLFFDSQEWGTSLALSYSPPQHTHSLPTLKSTCSTPLFKWIRTFTITITMTKVIHLYRYRYYAKRGRFISFFISKKVSRPEYFKE